MTKSRRKIEELRAEVTAVGHTAHVYVPKEWIGKTVVVRLVEK